MSDEVLRIKFRVVCAGCGAQLFLRRRIERWGDWRGLKCGTCGPLRVREWRPDHLSKRTSQRERERGYLTIRAEPERT